MAFEVIKQNKQKNTFRSIRKKEKEIKRAQISNATLCHGTLLTILITFFPFTVNNSTKILC